TNCLIQLLKNSWLSLSSQPRSRILQQPFNLSSCFSKNFFFLLNDLQQPQLHFFRFGEARILQRPLTSSSCFLRNFFLSQQLSASSNPVRLSEARILHHPGRL